MIQRPRKPHVALSGALAGIATVIVFTAAHHVLISDIWFSLIPMLVVGALCGAALSWSYAVVCADAAPGSWVRYNLSHLTVLLLLGAGSMAVFDPITTAAALMASPGPPPDELFARALPFTGLFTLGATAVLGVIWGRTLPKVGAILVATVALVFLFGLNISIIGLVEMSGDGYRALAEFLGLTAFVLASNTAFFLLLERRGLFRHPAATPTPATADR